MWDNSSLKILFTMNMQLLFASMTFSIPLPLFSTSFPFTGDWTPLFILLWLFGPEFYFSSDHILLAILPSLCSPCPQATLPRLPWLSEHSSSKLGHENTCQSIVKVHDIETPNPWNESSHWIREPLPLVWHPGHCQYFQGLTVAVYFPPLLLEWAWNC